jgi:Protein of unknown function (DUF2442)
MAATDITKALLKRAELRTTRKQTRGRAVKATYDAKNKRVVLELDTGIWIAFAADAAEALAGRSARELSTIEITPSGLGLHWPRLDADLYLPALLDGLLGTRKWVAAKLGASGGRARSRVKVASSRKNGKLGGRPRRVATG